MRDTAFVMRDDMRARKAKIHQRVDGNLVPLDLELPQPAEVELGGAGLYGTVGDYLKFVRMILNKGAGENGRSEEHTPELQSLMRISYAVFCLNKHKQTAKHTKAYIQKLTLRTLQSARKRTQPRASQPNR